MPNWTHNIVGFEAPKNKLEEIKAKLFSDKNVFDFNKVIPMPEHSEKFHAKGNLGDQERKKFGDNNWYHWSVYNWGTKWNSVRAEVSEESDNCINYHFDTAWDAPRPIIQEICTNGMLKDCSDFYWTCYHENEEEPEEIIKTIACADYVT
ncbi:MAG: hypothetical protein CBC05_08685 [Crocinitomicaceae bacterium TMED45]|nr:MAG: hypothetical protein CBC05_08685 [Crocinitomicaceae bacterium TMED45]|tara:strand:- start:15562 stop:16011 length:450 start_codon:yes stop_codon:yes gene_type:complete